MIRIFGAALLLLSCCGFGFSLSVSHRKELDMLRTLKKAVQEMEWELKYRMTELPELCILAGNMTGGVLKDIFMELANKMKNREVMDISACFNGIIGQKELPRRVRRNLRQLSVHLGRFDLDGQLQGLEAIRQQCCIDIMELKENSRERLHSYQVIAACMGTALVILLI